MFPALDNLLRQCGLAQHEAVRAAIDEACYNQTSFVDAILDCEGVNERVFLQGLTKTLSLPWWEPDGDKPVDRTLRRHLPAEIALRNRLLPIAIDTKPSENAHQAIDQASATEPVALHIACCDPLNLVARQQLASSVSLPVIWHMGMRTRVVEGLQKMYGLGADTFEKILRGRADWGAEELDQEVTVLDNEPEDEEASVVRFVNQILRRGLEQRATDIHVEPQQDRLRIRYRIDGRLEELPVPDNIKQLQASVIARLKIMARLDIAEKRLPQDGRINLELDGLPIDVRVATIPSVEGESVSLRLLGQQQVTLDRLGMADTIRPVVDELLKLPNGIILITGPTGSGKSTSLYGFLTQLNQTHRRIVTIEDPVEYKMPGVVQIAVKPEIGLSFATGLRSILRGDPNVVMVGEMRDLETAEIAIEASLTGHLVLSTLHTNDAPSATIRMIDMGVEPYLISATVIGVLAQRLGRQIDKEHREPYEVPAIDLRRFGFNVTDPDEKVTLYRGVPHEANRQTGYRGRTGFHELMIMNGEIAELVVRRAALGDLKSAAKANGMKELREDGLEKVLAGLTDPQEVMRVVFTAGF